MSRTRARADAPPHLRATVALGDDARLHAALHVPAKVRPSGARPAGGWGNVGGEAPYGGRGRRAELQGSIEVQRVDKLGMRPRPQEHLRQHPVPTYYGNP